MGYFSEVHTQILGTFQRRRRFPLHISQRKILLLSVDLFLLNIALILGIKLSSYILPHSPKIVFNLHWLVLITLLWLTIANTNNNYDIKQASKLNVSALGIIKSVLIMGVVLATIHFLFSRMSMNWLSYLLVTTFVASLLVLWRTFYATFLDHSRFKRRALIAGDGLAGRAIVEAINKYNPGYEIVGYIPTNSSGGGQGFQGVKRISKWGNLITFVQEQDVSDIILTIPRDVKSNRQQAILKCFEKGVRIVPMAELFEEITGQIPVEYIGERWLNTIPVNWDSKKLYLLIKRAMDIIIASIGVLVLLPFFPLIIMAIKLDSPGPVFYRPVRQGQGGKSIQIWKFRTMVTDADRIGDPTFTAKKDNRITRVGRILRVSHMDELPQFINILTGDMSLVGPRPERYVPAMEANIPFYRARFAVKPGATGWALVNQGYAEGLDGTLIKLQYDLYYIKHQSLTFDILILCKSIMHMLTLGGQ